MKLLAAVLLPLALMAAAAAQAPKLEVFGGYSVEHIAPCGANTSATQEFSCGLESGELQSSKGYFNGWEAAATGYFKRYLGITADVAGHYGAFSTASRYSFLFGPTFKLRLPILAPFAHALFGFVKETASNEFESQFAFTKAEFALGGGVDVNVSRHLAVRPIQLDYEWQKTPTTGIPNPTGFRLAAGVVFKF
jgi:opacity protein-like surface antigen